eukprot:CAMPEP_0197183126 /NCGR_PEP_ID=MMETSP1423-20130617/7492_1 /TAXON_ID=476441 /ORGANISM="Pseudo-nitzschia heimii, Strain UNC1101" /LENGTH=128 /DNA_ID=CAMNT_0042633673 /DNA_START=314 /DNA_END=700 /DNA_ORIENTATION=+
MAEMATVTAALVVAARMVDAEICSSTAETANSGSGSIGSGGGGGVCCAASEELSASKTLSQSSSVKHHRISDPGAFTKKSVLQFPYPAVSVTWQSGTAASMPEAVRIARDEAAVRNFMATMEDLEMDL